MPGFGVTSSVTDTLPPGVASSADGEAATCACAADPLNWSDGALCANATEENRTNAMAERIDGLYRRITNPESRVARRRIGPTPMRILLVEDDPDIAELIVRYLEKAEYSVERASNGRA